MLSVILYGRNDRHGYNYHKRLAISINCIAEMLSFENDEIVFVDYNSSEDEPTVIEALADTLTEKAKKVLKVYRVHLIQKKSKLLNEPLARNIAIRRTNPQNKWVLSTNIDMVFVPVASHETLSSLVAELPEGFYELPRFELPENLWESHFNRLKPDENIAFLRKKAPHLHLNTIVRRPGCLVYDNPGDFQLMPRKTIFAMHGFNEQMNQGWHVDSNLCKRMSIYCDKIQVNLEDKLWGYHCNHTRQETAAHKQHAPENDWKTFVTNVETPYLPKQSETWGLAGEELEKIPLKEAKDFSQKTSHENPHPSDISIDQNTFNTLTYSSKRIFPHLSDHFHHLPPQSNVAYIGHNQELLSLMKEAVSVLTLDEETTLKDLYDQSKLIIFDFGFDETSCKGFAIAPTHQHYQKLRESLKDVMDAFLKIVRLEKTLQKNIKLLGINVLFTDFQALFQHHLSLRKTTFLTGISFGYVKRKQRFLVGSKKQLKFLLMYLVVRYFYRFTDKVRAFVCRNFLLKKMIKRVL